MRQLTLWPPSRPLPPLVRARTVEVIAVAQKLTAATMLIVTQMRAEQLRRWSDPDSPLASAAIAGGTGSLSEQSIREHIRTRLASGQLKAMDGMIVVARPDNGTCSACELAIEPAEASTVGYRYRDGEYHGFHVRCAALWEEERRRAARLREAPVMLNGVTILRQDDLPRPHPG
jgi:hypothetical protein